MIERTLAPLVLVFRLPMFSRLRSFVTSKQFGVVIMASVLALGALAAAFVDRSTLALALILSPLLIGVALSADTHRKVGNIIRRLELGRRESVAAAMHLEASVSELLGDLKGILAAVRTVENTIASIEASRVDASNELAVLRMQLAARLDRIYVDFDQVMSDLRSSLGRMDRMQVSVSDRLASIDEGQSVLRDDSKRALKDLERIRNDTITEIDALMQLHDRFTFDGRVPLVGGWALAPRTLIELVNIVTSEDVQMVLELGSGTSTLFAAKALEHANSGGRLVALEHLSDFAEFGNQLLKEHGLDHVAEVRFAPLVETEIDGKTYLWYDTGAVTDVRNIDVLIVDGPPQTTGTLARYPAYPMLRDRLNDAAILVVDDFSRPDERQMVKMWLDDSQLEESKFLSRVHRILYFNRVVSNIPEEG